MTDIKIFMCCHNKFYIVPALTIPIQCGAELAPPIIGAVPDIAGANGSISSKNREYCELTAHYYAWKNVHAEYYGFCHYRRFFCFDNSDNTKKPYLVFGKLKENEKHLLGTEEMIKSLCNEFEIVIPFAEDMGITVKEHYCTSKFHYAKDLENFMKILYESAPHMVDCANSYISQNKQYFCNMFIMDKTHFFEYCEILFNVLGKFDINKKKHGDFQSDRVDGYLGEIFTGIYITYAKKNDAIIKELPRIDVNCTFSKRLFYKLFPPESKRRFLVKKAIKLMV